MKTDDLQFWDTLYIKGRYVSVPVGRINCETREEERCQNIRSPAYAFRNDVVYRPTKNKRLAAIKMKEALKELV